MSRSELVLVLLWWSYTFSVSSEPRVWGSMTTIPSRLHFLELAITSILDKQTVPLHALILNLPSEIR